MFFYVFTSTKTADQKHPDIRTKTTIDESAAPHTQVASDNRRVLAAGRGGGGG